jgi:flavoprotein hydroxylase
MAMANPRPHLSAGQRDFLATIGTRLIHMAPPGQLTPEDARRAGLDTVCDLDNVLRDAGHAAAIVRPDFYLYGTAASLTDLPELVDELRAGLARTTR